MRLSTLFLAICAVVSSERDVRIRHLHVISEIQSRFAITDVLSEIENRGRRAQEVTFSAQLPENAFITNFSLEQNGVITRGMVKEKNAARQEYEDARNEGRTASEVRKQARQTNKFEISVNIGANSKANFNLTYQEVLHRVHSVYKHVVNIQPNHPVDDIQVDVLIAEREPISLIHVPEFGEKTGQASNKELLLIAAAPDVEVRSTNDKSGSLAYVYYKPETGDGRRSGQLVILYDVERSRDGGQIEVVNGYFVHYVAPADIHKGDKHVIFVLDKSGSMKGRKITQLKNAMRTILDELAPTDRVNLLTFSNDVHQWAQASVPATKQNIHEAKRFVDGIEAADGTNIHAALDRAIDLLENDRSDPFASMVVFLTDGKPTAGEQNPTTIVDRLTNKNTKASQFSIHSIAFGEDADYGLMKRISGRNKGLARKVYEDADAALQINGFYEEIAIPLLRDVKVDYVSENVDVGSLVQENKDTLFEGGEQVTVGKLKPNKQQDVVAKVSAVSVTGPLRLQASSVKSVTTDGHCFPTPPTASRSASQRFSAVPRKLIVLCDEVVTRVERPEPLQANTVGGFIERMWAYKSIQKYMRLKDVQANGPEEVANVERQIRNMALKVLPVLFLSSRVGSTTIYVRWFIYQLCVVLCRIGALTAIPPFAS